jgi:hypothetical protein
MTSQRQGGFRVQTAGGTIPPRHLSIGKRFLRALAVLLTEPKPSPYSWPRLEGDTIIFDSCEAYPFGKILPLPGGQDPTPRTGNEQGRVLAEAMRKALGGW